MRRIKPRTNHQEIHYLIDLRTNSKSVPISIIYIIMSGLVISKFTCSLMLHESSSSVMSNVTNINSLLQRERCSYRSRSSLQHQHCAHYGPQKCRRAYSGRCRSYLPQRCCFQNRNDRGCAAYRFVCLSRVTKEKESLTTTIGCPSVSADVEGSVRADVLSLRASPHIRADIPIIGYVLDTTTGQLREVKYAFVPRN